MRKFLLIIIVLFSVTVFADVQMSPEYECCVETNARLLEQIENQNKIIISLKDIEKSIILSNDTLKHSIKIQIDNTKKLEKPEKNGYDLCSIIGGIIGAIISGGIAIFIFWKGRENEKIKENQKLIDFGEEVYTLIKNIVANSKKQSELLENLVLSIKEKPYTHGKYHRVSFNLLERAKSFDTSYIFSTFKALNLEKKSYIKFYSFVDFLLEVFTNIDSDYHENNSKVITPLSNDFIQQREAIFKVCTDFIELKRKEKDTNGAFYNFINQLVINYYSSENLPDTIDIKYDVEMLIRPLKIELLAKYRDNDLSNVLIDHAKRAGDLYQTIIIQSSSLANEISSQIETIKETVTKLELIEKDLSTNYAS